MQYRPQHHLPTQSHSKPQFPNPGLITPIMQQIEEAKEAEDVAALEDAVVVAIMEGLEVVVLINMPQNKKAPI
ncbi:hypothetical protein DAPPUDRAFT_267796 [Daphnia pulex]|uniref:Uncharacterized protein n=1 Tax=Daphnia pulex TaxID=6669 RepID=E9HWY7_DAPPU|nr:hypothetical protein DAPPUDRAFT_267796 [Daphnia pulex]|eukprot:EFX63745.1 hypothetical protein DAPPUDRAFT_267796 [Daphnia pulex]